MADDGSSWQAFEAVVYVKAWKLKAKVVVVHRYDNTGKLSAHSTLVSTDVAQSGTDLLLNVRFGVS